MKLAKVIESRFFVTGISDEILGERLTLIIEGEEEDFDVEFPASLHKFEIPREIFYIKKFIETDSKKVDRNKTLALKK